MAKSKIGLPSLSQLSDLQVLAFDHSVNSLSSKGFFSNKRTKEIVFSSFHTSKIFLVTYEVE